MKTMGNLRSVSLYSSHSDVIVDKNRLKLRLNLPLPYHLSAFATVRWYCICDFILLGAHKADPLTFIKLIYQITKILSDVFNIKVISSHLSMNVFKYNKLFVHFVEF